MASINLQPDFVTIESTDANHEFWNGNENEKSLGLRFQAVKDGSGFLSIYLDANNYATTLHMSADQVKEVPKIVGESYEEPEVKEVPLDNKSMLIDLFGENISSLNVEFFNNN